MKFISIIVIVLFPLFATGNENNNEYSFVSNKCISVITSVKDGKIMQQESEVINYQCIKDGNLAICKFKFGTKNLSDTFSIGQKGTNIFLFNDNTRIRLDKKTKHGWMHALSMESDGFIVSKLCNLKFK